MCAIASRFRTAVRTKAALNVRERIIYRPGWYHAQLTARAIGMPDVVRVQFRTGDLIRGARREMPDECAGIYDIK